MRVGLKIIDNNISSFAWDAEHLQRGALLHKLGSIFLPASEYWLVYTGLTVSISIL
jgi:hypothetical protein